MRSHNYLLALLFLYWRAAQKVILFRCKKSYLLALVGILWGVNGCTLVSPTLRTLQLLALSQAEGNGSTGAPLSVRAQTTDSPLLRMLGYVPNEPAYREYLTFGDVAAWYRATGMARVDSAALWQQLAKPERDRWAFDLPIQTLPPDVLGLRYLLVEDMRHFYGFSFFEAERFLESGMPPGNVTIVETRADPAQIDAALLAAGYTIMSVTGGKLYSLHDDNEIDLRSPTKVGQLGQLNRIARLDSTLIIGRATAVVNQSIDSVNGAGATLADDPIYQALAGALAAPEAKPFGELVGALLIGQPLATDPLVMLNENPEAIQRQLDVYAQAPLPPYLALGFATQRLGDSTYLTLAVVFPPGVDGVAAAALLGERLATYTSVVTGHPLQEQWSLEQAVAVDTADLPLALVTMLVVQTDASAVEHRPPFTWGNLVFQRDLLFLLMGEPVQPE